MIAFNFSRSCVALALLGAPQVGLAEEIPMDAFNACGRTSLYLAAHLKGKAPTWNEVGRSLGKATDGTHSFADIIRAAQQLGLHTVAAQVDRTTIAAMAAPAIVHCELPSFGESPRMHFALAVEWDSTGVFVLDAPDGVQLVPWDHFNRFWTGKTLFFTDTSEEAKRLCAALTPPLDSRIAPWISSLVIVICAGLLLRRGLARFAARGEINRERLLGGARRLSLPRRMGKLEWNLPSRRVLLAAVSIALALVSATLYTYAPKTSRLGAFLRGSPWVEFPAGPVDFGELDPGEQHKSLTLANLGRMPLEVDFVESNCGCAAADVGGQVVAPGDDLVLPLSLGVTPGRSYVELALHCNDPRSPLRWTVSWQGAAQPLLVPARIFANDVPLRSSYQRTVRLVFPASVGGSVPRLVGFTCEDPRVRVSQGTLVPFSFRLDPFSHGGSPIAHVELDVTVAAPTAPGSIRTACHLDVKLGEKTTRLKLPIAVSFAGDITVETSRVLFCAPTLSGLVGTSRTVRILGADGNPGTLEIRDVPSWLEATTTSPTETVENSVLLAVRTVPPRHFESARLWIVVHAGESEIRLPLTVLTFATTGG